ncbi:L-methionine/branched-chain amino acid transporter [Rheinheimera mesophila]|uniref:L-methionine/branched-chain amino acid transporter n=1 Tax=Rheinheimera mesophila TaxID=1547515 RepID=A0A3P3QK70_9GAMM|nr:L-methionine/branched-chain amino acid transporter [Rheinheimera mesophila]KKL00009.1 transporter [Rheinheimera mesophila]RRJ21468.1 L-methionine/branched-chain amino acid transporter [Rheinheimera mesophila]
MSDHGIGRWQGAALMATTLLGTGVFILPQMTVAVAGSWALLAWLLLTLAVVPLAITFGLLASRFPHATGPAHFAALAFGELTGRVLGLMFLLVVPLGASAALMMTFEFIAPLLPSAQQWRLPVEFGLLGLLWLLNYRGLQLSARLQFGLTLLIITVVLLLLLAFGLLHPQPWQYPSPADFNRSALAAACAIAFWSFLGVEAMTHLAHDFRDASKDLLPALLRGCLVVGAIYLACSYLVLMAGSEHPLAMIGIFNQLLGGYGELVLGMLGFCSGIATVNVYTASVARSLASFSEQGITPGYFQQKNRYHMPQRALSAIIAAMAVVLVLTWLTAQQLDDLISWVNGVFVVIYLVSMAAACQLLPRRYKAVSVLSFALCLLLVIAIAEHMLYALLLILLVWPALYIQQRKQRLSVPPLGSHPSVDG